MVNSGIYFINRNVICWQDPFSQSPSSLPVVSMVSQLLGESESENKSVCVRERVEFWVFVNQDINI